MPELFDFSLQCDCPRDRLEGAIKEFFMSYTFSGDMFISNFLQSDWQYNNITKKYAEATTVGRFTYDRMWKSLAQICNYIGYTLKPFDSQCGSKRYMGIECSEGEYTNCIKPVIDQLKPLRTEEEFQKYFKELANKKLCTPLEQRILRIYRVAKSAFAPVPTLVFLSMEVCEKLKLIPEENENIKIALEHIKQKNAPHQLPDLIDVDSYFAQKHTS